ncbi:hypothetical protein BDV97DRAFT_107068 [Delphinella strobiligena]|nr:hypothetical protein BDV97DRAFT_107068 [Delphinella strobiligena]
MWRHTMQVSRRCMLRWIRGVAQLPSSRPPCGSPSARHVILDPPAMWSLIRPPTTSRVVLSIRQSTLQQQLRIGVDDESQFHSQCLCGEGQYPPQCPRRNITGRSDATHFVSAGIRVGAGCSGIAKYTSTQANSSTSGWLADLWSIIRNWSKRFPRNGKRAGQLRASTW